MKTLDEVIEELQYWDTCHEYPECFYDDEVTKDALNYLKEYKRVQNKIEKIALGNIEDTLDKLDNKPLTWDELKQMEGKPIWMEFTYHNPEETYKYWTIVKYFDNDEGGAKMITGTGVYHKCAIDTDWQAYRKENNGR